MPIASTDLLVYHALNRPTDDTTTTGGAIDLDWRPVFTQLAANDDIEVLSSAAGDTTQTATIWGRNAAGEIVTQAVTLSGTTAVIFSTAGILERVLRCQISADAVGTVTFRRSIAGATVATIAIGERGTSIMFYDSSSDPSVTKTRYEKVFYLNNHATLTLTNAKVQLSADPSTKLNISVDDAVNGTTTAANRVTNPGVAQAYVGVGVQITVPGGGNLAAASRIGMWIRQSLGVADTPIKNTFDLRADGTSV